MALENEVADLRTEVEKLKRRRDQGEEIKHKIWNNMQEDIHRLCNQNHEQLVAFRAETEVRFEQFERKVDQRFEQVDKRFEQIDQRFEQMDQRIGRLETDVSTMKSDISEIKAILLNKSFRC